MKSFFDLAKTRRSIRRFTGNGISDETVKEILKAALLAPSSWGQHPVEFVVVRDKSMLKKLSKCKRMGAGPLPDADVAIVVLIDRENCDLWIEDGAVASTYILLAAEEQEVGACWIHMRDRAGQVLSAEEEIRSLLQIPDRYAVLNVVALGEKGEPKAPYAEQDLQWKLVHEEQFYKAISSI